MLYFTEKKYTKL